MIHQNVADPRNERFALRELSRIATRFVPSDYLPTALHHLDRQLFPAPARPSSSKT